MICPQLAQSTTKRATTNTTISATTSWTNDEVGRQQFTSAGHKQITGR